MISSSSPNPELDDRMTCVLSPKGGPRRRILSDLTAREPTGTVLMAGWPANCYSGYIEPPLNALLEKERRSSVFFLPPPVHNSHDKPLSPFDMSARLVPILAVVAASLKGVQAITNSSTLNLPPYRPYFVQKLPQDIAGLAIELDRWPDWTGNYTNPNTFTYQLLQPTTLLDVD